MPKLRFGLRSVLSVMVMVAIAMFGWQRYCAYCRTHVSIQAVDQVSGVALAHFEYRVRIITSESKPESLYSSDSCEATDWRMHKSGSSLVLAIPEFCRLEIYVRSLDLGGGYDEKMQEELILPDLSHSIVMRMRQGEVVDGLVLDALTKQPLPDVLVTNEVSNDNFKVCSDKSGRFRLRNVDIGRDILAVHREYQIFHQSTENLQLGQPVVLELTKARRIVGQVRCSTSGEPLTNCTISQPCVIQSNFAVCGCFGVPQMQFLERTSTTDEEGRFEYLFDDSASAWLEISKPGWSMKSFSIKEEQPDLNSITLDLPYSVIKRKVVDHLGKPVNEINVQVDRWPYRWDLEGNEVQHISNEQGEFAFRIPSSRIEVVSIRSKCGEVFHGPLPMPSLVDENEQLQDLTIRLQQGYILHGKLVGTPEALRLTEMVLLRGFNESDEDGIRIDSTDLSTWRSKIGEDGDFSFEHLTDGEFTLVTLCNGYLVHKRPVVIADQDVTVRNAELPPLLNVSGTIESSDGSLARILSFELDQQGHQSFFRTNHLGNFALNNIPAGNYKLKATNDWQDRWASVTFAEGRQYDLSLREAPFLEIDPTVFADYEEIIADYNVIGSRERKVAKPSFSYDWTLLGESTKGQMEATVTFSSPFGSREVFVNENVDTSIGPIRLDLRPRILALDFADEVRGGMSIRELNKRAEIHGLLMEADDPFEDEDSPKYIEARNELSGLVSDWSDRDHTTHVFFLHDGKMLASIVTEELPASMEVVLPRLDPDTCVVHNSQLGWAKMDSPEVSIDQIKLPKIRFESGANVKVKCDLRGLPTFPRELTLIHSDGATFSRKINSNRAVEEFDFYELWPGRWTVELTGLDPYRGTIVLDRKDVLLGDTLEITVALHGL